MRREIVVLDTVAQNLEVDFVGEVDRKYVWGSLRRQSTTVRDSKIRERDVPEAGSGGRLDSWHQLGRNSNHAEAVHT